MAVLREFRCAVCGATVELFVSLSGQLVATCSSCQRPMVRVISVPAIRGETVSRS